MEGLYIYYLFKIMIKIDKNTALGVPLDYSLPVSTVFIAS